MDNLSPFEFGGFVFITANLNPGKFLKALMKAVFVVTKSKFLTYNVDPGSSDSVVRTSFDPFFASTPESFVVGSISKIPTGAFSRYRGWSLNRRYARRLNAALDCPASWNSIKAIVPAGGSNNLLTISVPP